MGVGLRGNSARCFTARNTAAAAAAHPLPLLRFAPAAFNEYTGCAWCGALYALVCLQDHRWEDVGYTEVDCRTVKVAVLDKAVLKTNDNETRLLQPFALQRRIDEAVGKVSGGRAFVRASNTEDVVRIYAEARAGLDGLIQDLVAAVEQSCGAKSKL